MALNEDTILTFLLEHGGKVRNSELVTRFKSRLHCSDPAGKQHNRDLFKKLVNSVAVVKQIDNIKFVVAKKIYRDFVKADAEAGLNPEGGRGRAHPDPSCPRTTSSPFNISDQCESVGMLVLQNNQMGDSVNFKGNCNYNTIHNHTDINALSIVQEAMAPPMNAYSTEDEQSLKVVNIPCHQCIPGESGAVFAVILVNSPPRTSIRHDLNAEEPSEYTTPDKPPQVKHLSQTAPAVDRYRQIFERNTWNASKSCENLAEVHDQDPPAVMKSKSTVTRRADEATQARYSESIPLDPIAHEWLVKSGAGMWRHIYGLLLLDTQLVNKRDFMSGFTALHWAAKAGNGDMVRQIMDISRSKGTRVDVDGKTHGGYTALHIAAIHGHGGVVALLVQGYGARVNVRDNAGKKPWHYLGPGAAFEVKELLGGRPTEHCGDQTGGEDYREMLPKGLNTISKLFQSQHSHRRKHRHQPPPPGLAGLDGF